MTSRSVQRRLAVQDPIGTAAKVARLEAEVVALRESLAWALECVRSEFESSTWGHNREMPGSIEDLYKKAMALLLYGSHEEARR